MPMFSGAVSFLMNTTDGSRATQQNNYTKATYLIQKDSVGVFKGWFMVLVADTAYINGDFSKLNKNSYRSKDPTYSGRLLYFDIQGQFLGGWRYLNGAITKTITLTNFTTNSQQVNDSKIKTNLVQTCHTIPITTVTWECITVQISPESVPYTTCTAHYDYTYETECNSTGGSGGGSGGGGGGSGSSGGENFPDPPKPDCPPVAVSSIDGRQVNVVSGGGPCTPTIKNLVKNPCLKKMVDAAINANVKNEVSKLIQNVFGGTAQPDLTFSDVYIGNPDIDGQTNARFTNNGTFLSANIELNNNVLPNASQEYIAATIMHEALHAYLSATSSGLGQLEHETIAVSYVNKMATSLQQMFPTLSSSDAKALAYGGLQGTAAYNFNISNFGLSANYSTVNSNYKTGTQGHAC